MRKAMLFALPDELTASFYSTEGGAVRSVVAIGTHHSGFSRYGHMIFLTPERPRRRVGTAHWQAPNLKDIVYWFIPEHVPVVDLCVELYLPLYDVKLIKSNYRNQISYCTCSVNTSLHEFRSTISSYRPHSSIEN